MGTKTISIMDDVYDLLTAVKAPEESFSDELRRLATAKGSIMEFAGIWKLADKEAEKIKKSITNMRSTTRLDELRKRA